ncbi:uncharacterized protein LOC105431614 [Pogonomyrmex barbatus]|uniref:Uncharacterized protein LOC105431614 n=1 Tax=Pogonomyrmex barbatus TaxID=144034 RepID=A0A6I9WQ79_9HYME|nr:uncharacterized protein LOC105431614 [Pogonomyrmex barbatus]
MNREEDARKDDTRQLTMLLFEAWNFGQCDIVMEEGQTARTIPWIKNCDEDARDRKDGTRQMPILLFEAHRGLEQHEEVGRTTSRYRVSGNFLRSSSSFASQLFVTSPIAKRTTPVPPNAPIKLRKPFSKARLKPKKLRFVDKEKDEAKDENCSQKRTNYSIKIFKQKAEFSEQQSESRYKFDRDSLSAVLHNMRLELDKKENETNERECNEKRTRNKRSVVKKCVKNNNSVLRSSTLNYSSKDKTIAICFISEIPRTEKIEEGLIQNKYNAGSSV